MTRTGTVHAGFALILASGLPFAAACGVGKLSPPPGDLDASGNGRGSGDAGGVAADADTGRDAIPVGDSGMSKDSTVQPTDAAASSEAGPSPVVLRSTSADKVDLLFMIDNSASMGDKQALLAQAIPDLVARLVTPNCIAADGSISGRSDMNGVCASGAPEFAPVHDMHIGIVTSSLGGRGGNECSPGDSNPANPVLSAHEDDRGELINRGGDNETPVTNAEPLNFLSWFPTTPVNLGKAMPQNPETQVGAPGMAGTLIGDFTSMIRGVHEHGCGFEAQNEAWYRFLVQPDPFDSIAINVAKASLVGVDSVILQQRAAFLRPDSLLAIIVVTDENEEVANPLSVGGQGWLLENYPWPNSPNGVSAPEGTIECQSNPNDPNCTSCAFASVRAAFNFTSRCPPDPPMGVQGYLDPSNDQVNVRFFNQKARFGLFAGYPISRYIRGLSSLTVPDRFHEVDGSGNYVGDQDTYANCVNPIFAQNLPTSPTADLCHLTPGPRTSDLVFYAAIAGVPHQLLQARPGDPECPAATASADCPQKATLTASDWVTITGRDPEHYDFTGADFHMLESMSPRSGAVCQPTASDNCDPVNGREWDTLKNDLEFACIFPLVDPVTGAPQPKDCTSMAFAQACDCAPLSASQNTPLCQKNGAAYTNNQIFGKAYPSVREMAIAHAMAISPVGVQGIASSLCPIHTSYANGNPADPLFGYRPAIGAIVNHLKSGFTVGCLTQPLAGGSAGTGAKCSVFATLTSAGQGGESACVGIPGLSIPPADALQTFQQAQHRQWVAAGGSASGSVDPSTSPSCLMQQLTLAANPTDFQNGSCQNSADPGWCYVAGRSGGTCTQQVVFSPSEPPHGAIVSLLCAN